MNGNGADNYDDVQCWVRTGRVEQDTIPGFERVEQQLAVNIELTQSETEETDNSPVVITDPLGNGDDPIWDEHGAAFDINTISDAFRIVLNFPSGLYEATNTGALIPSRVQVQVRYIELDEFGVPITTGGNAGDGYARLVPEPIIEAAIQGGFQYQIEKQCLDPQQYTPQLLGRCFSSGGAAADMARLDISAGVNFPVTWTAGSNFAIFTVEGWVALPQNALAGSTFVSWFSWYDGVNDTGFEISFEERTYNAGQTTTVMVPVVRIGDGSAISTFWENQDQNTLLPTFTIVETDATQPTYFHVLLTYGAQLEDGNTVELYINGQLLFRRTQTRDVEIPAASIDWQLHSRLGTDAGSVAARTDELVVWNRYMTQQEAQQRYNNGAGQYGDGSEVAMVAGYHFETQGGGPTTTPDYSGSGNDMLVEGSSAAGVFNGHVFLPPSAPVKRSRWRVEVLRVNLDSTSARVADQCDYQALVAILSEEFSYPGGFLLGGRIRASEQLGGGEPNITTLIRHRKALRWDGESETSPFFIEEWTRNPAWNFVMLLLDKEVGLGNDFTPSQLVLSTFKGFADFCDVVIYDGRHRLLSADSEVTDARYFQSTQDDDGNTRGSIEFYLSTAVPPGHWIAGHYIRVQGFPTPGDDPAVQIDINNGATGGYEIRRTYQLADLRWIVEVFWDRLTEGNPWTDSQRIETLINPDTLEGDYEVILEGGEPRMELDDYLDTERFAFETLQDLAGSCRASLVKLAGKVKIVWEAERSRVGILTRRDIVPGTFSIDYGGKKNRFNAVTVGFRDRAKHYERDSVGPIEHSSLADPSSTDDFRHESFYLRGATRRSQVTRHANFLLETNHRIKRSGGMLLEKRSLPFQVGDRVQLAMDLLPRGTSGALQADSANDDEVVIDSTVVLASGETYRVALQDPNDGAYVTRDVTSLAGTYVPGDTIAVASDFPFTPKKRSAYIICRVGDELDVVIGRTSLEEGIRIAVEWVEYNEAVYDVDTISEPQTLEASIADEPQRRGALTVPENVKDLAATIEVGPGGPVLHASWNVPSSSAAHVAEQRIFATVEGGAPRRVATCDGPANSVSVPMPALEDGQTVRVWVQPVSSVGARRRTTRISSTSVVFQRVWSAPEPVTGLSADFVEDQVVYSWDLPTGGEGLVVEARRGGWLLAPVVFESSPGASRVGPMRDWAAGDLVVRTRDARGRYSSQATLTVAPDVEKVTAAVELSYQTQAWEDFGDGWTLDTPGGNPNTTLTDLQRNADGELEFAGSALTATFETVDAVDARTKPNGLTARELYVSAAVAALQVHPLKPEDMNFPAGDPRASQLTPEGWADRSECTLKLEFRYSTNGLASGWSSWREFRPLLLRAVGLQWRITVTRPSTDYQIRLLGFSTESASRKAGFFDVPDEQGYLWTETFL